MKLAAEKRGEGGLGELRRSGRLPAVVYNKDLNVPVSVDERSFDKAFRAVGSSSLIDLEVDGEVHSVLVKQVQMDKRRRKPMHVDFYAVSADEPVVVHVPIEFVGSAVGVRAGGQLDVQRREVTISVLPRYIPNHVEVDVSALEVGDSLHVGDLVANLPSEAHVLDDLELAIVAVVPPRVTAEEVEAEAEAAEPEVVGREEEEGEEPSGDEE
ncbi:MAG TPA: 50S ribosomal protein L25 [Trueperaceae bacterium]|jgi:large subunit ribosomal protein L25